MVDYHETLFEGMDRAQEEYVDLVKSLLEGTSEAFYKSPVGSIERAMLGGSMTAIREVSYLLERELDVEEALEDLLRSNEMNEISFLKTKEANGND